jgi:SAM-dependent methyltransferase
MTAPNCRLCGARLNVTFADLGMSPLSNAYVAPARAGMPDPCYPLHAYVCERCFLVQLGAPASREQIFSDSDYLYFSSFSEDWLAHCRAYAEMAASRFGLEPGSSVIEVASNDGYLLQYFLQRGMRVLGIEPAGNVAQAARTKGIETRTAFFGEATGRALAAEGCSADLMAANNVLAHVPDLHDFVEGFRHVLKPRAVLTVEFPWLKNLIAETQFDTIYHEHFSYFALATAQRAFADHGLEVFDVEELPTHGGSLRLYVGQQGAYPAGPAVARVIAAERAAGLDRIETYRAFAPKIEQVRSALLAFLRQARADGRRVAGYGAPAKGNILLNYCGVGTDLIEFTVDRNPHKQGRLLPGSHIPIRAPEAIGEARPDYVLILPWNLRAEIARQLAGIRDWGGKFVTPIPRLDVF